jgi:hypothetical protein
MIVVTGIGGGVLVAVLHCVVVAIDIVTFFLVVRVLVMRWPKGLLVEMDRVGSPVVESVSQAIGSTCHVQSLRGRLVLSLTILALCRLGIVLLFQSLAHAVL